MKNLRELAKQLGLKEEVDCFIDYYFDKGRKTYIHQNGFEFLYVEEDVYEKLKDNEFVKSIKDLNIKTTKEAYFLEDSKYKKKIYFLDTEGYEWYFVKEVGTEEDYKKSLEEFKALSSGVGLSEIDWQEADINDIQLTSVDKRD